MFIIKALFAKTGNDGSVAAAEQPATSLIRAKVLFRYYTPTSCDSSYLAKIWGLSDRSTNHRNNPLHLSSCTCFF